MIDLLLEVQILIITYFIYKAYLKDLIQRKWDNT